MGATSLYKKPKIPSTSVPSMKPKISNQIDNVPKKEPRPRGRPRKISKDPVLADMEKFMYECENMISTPEGNIYDTENLLQILDAENNNHRNMMGATSSHTKPKTQSIRLMKRKMSVDQLFEETKKRPRGRPRKLCKASIGNLELHKLECCKKLVYPKKRRARRLLVDEPLNTATAAASVPSYCDAVTIRNTVLKEEIIDLTFEEDSYCVCLNFGTLCETKDCQESLETCDVFMDQANPVEVPNQLSEASLSTPDVRRCISEAVIDLTQCHDDDTPETPCSEKECANRIIPTIHKFHKFQQINKTVEEALEEMRGCLSQDATTESYFATVGLICNSAVSIGRTLVRNLSDMSVKNLNMARFLEIVVLKIEQQYDLTLTTTSVCCYLQVMLNQNREHCKNKLSRVFLEEIDRFAEKSRIKMEPSEFTGERYEQLLVQIQQYGEISRRQQQLMVEYSSQTVHLLTHVDGSSSKRLKSEMLEGQENQFQNEAIVQKNE